jgi:tetratricopeptide (TPR) repeat protein
LLKDAQLIASDAGLSASEIDWSGRAKDFWRSLLEEAKNKGLTEKVLDVAIARAPNVSELRQLRDECGAYLVSTPAGSVPSGPLQKPERAQHFVGREDELKALLVELQPGNRITLCGPGGMGKSALAAEAIWTLAPHDRLPERFPGGILFHTFYHQPQADLALEAIARAYGEEPRPNPAEAARRVLAGRRALLVLDGAEVAEDLEAVLAVAGSCCVLITTRRHEDAPAEWHDLRPLPVDEGIQLLQAWGGDRATDTRAVTRIVGLLGGLPLALRLAGRYMVQHRQRAADYLGWLEKTPLAALHFGERQGRSIPILMERSLAQVDQDARTSLGIAGILALTPFDREAVAAAFGMAPEEADRRLGELVDYGLLLRPSAPPGNPSGDRYEITHALIHTYAREKLAPDLNSLAALAEYYNALTLTQRELGLAGYRQLDADRGHLIAVQSACNRVGLWDSARKLTWAAFNYLDLQGRSTERVSLIQTGLAAARDSQSRYDEAAFLSLLGLAYADLGEARRAIGYHEQALAISREIGDRRGEGAHLGNMGIAYKDLGEVRQAIGYHEQALAIHREIGDRRGEGIGLGNLGIAYKNLGEVQQAIEYYEQRLVIAREIGDRRGEGIGLGNLGNAYFVLCEAQRAIGYYEQALAIRREIGDRMGEGSDLNNLGEAYQKLGEYEQSITYYRAAIANAQELGLKYREASRSWGLGEVYEAMGRYTEAAELMTFCVAWEQETGHADAEKDAARLAEVRAKIAT